MRPLDETKTAALKIVFSIPIHEKAEVVLDQIYNYKYFVKNPIIVIHVSSIFDWENSLIKEKEFIKVVNEIENVYVNPERIETSIGGLLVKIHNSNFNFASKLLSSDFNYFYLSSSNDLFILKGIENFIIDYDSGCDYSIRNQKNQDNHYWQSRKDLFLADIKRTLDIEDTFGSQVEGSFYSFKLFKEIYNSIEKVNSKNKNLIPYAVEEIYYPTILSRLVNRSRHYYGNLTYMNWNHELRIFPFDIKREISKGKFQVKRVPRILFTPLRVYIREKVGNYSYYLNLYGIDNLKLNAISSFLYYIFEYYKSKIYHIKRITKKMIILIIGYERYYELRKINRD